MKDKINLYTEYERFWRQYTSLYGPQTAIFLQVGMFYEFYDIQDPLTGHTVMNVKELTDYLGLQLTIRRGDAPGGKDGLFAGIPDFTIHKWAGRLTDAGWNVVQIDQVKDTSGKVKERRVARILSPGTHYENAAAGETPSICAIWLEPAGPQEPPNYGAAAFDLTTGHTYTTTGATRGRPDIWTSDELVHFLHVHSPREVILYYRGDAVAVPDEGTVRRRLTYPKGLLHIRLAHPEQQGPLELPLTREEFLRRIYNIQSLLPVREWLGFRDSVIQERVLCSLLRFVEDHLPSAFERLKQNTVWSSRSTLTLGNNAITQLQLTAPRAQDSVLGLFRSAITPMGRRGIRERLLIPTADGELIQRRLDDVSAAVAAIQADEIQPALRLLRMIYDLPRLHRRIDCYEVSAADILALNQSYLAAEELASVLASIQHLNVLSPATGLASELRKWRQETFEMVFSIEKAASASDDLTFLATTQSEMNTIREIEAEIAETRAAVQEFVDHCRRISGSSGEAISIESKREEPFAVSGTPQSIKSLAKNIAAADVIPAFKDVGFKHQKSGGWVECPWLTVQNHRVLRLREKLRSEFLKVLPGVCSAVAVPQLWAAVEAWIENFDITQCLAREAVARGWCKPQIRPYDTDRGSSLDIRGLRHPLIESIITRTEYVKHNVSLGQAEGSQGWLVYGMNASGKSSLMKAIGIAVHLAQAGSFVPASEMSLAPFKAIYTRILNQDNLWAGLSSFAVEMSEMRDILTAAGPNTLVLGDELCAGTESVSAQALVAAGIKWLSERKARYVFATHLHGLLNLLPDPAELSLQVWHLRVAFDPIRDILIYERHLRPGAGSSLYGLEVARAMHLPVEFIEVAQGLRRRLLGTAVEEEAPQSDWNSAITRRSCESCGAGIVADLEVHHIRGRAEAAGTRHFADGSGRDDARNLMVVCQRCHDDHHAGRIEFGRVIQTSAGPVRQITITQPQQQQSQMQLDTKILPQGPPPKSLNVLVNKLPEEEPAASKKKWTLEEQAIILDFVKKHAYMAAKQSVFFLHCNYKIEISEATLRKIKKTGSF